jgi:hypothetical protein
MNWASCTKTSCAVAANGSDGGWPISWVPPSPAAVGEWRAFITIKWLVVLDQYGRLRETAA